MFQKTRSLAVATVLVGASLGGCASSSDEIQAAYISPLAYQHYSCDQISAEMHRVSARANRMAGTVDENATNDQVAMGVGLVLFWPTLFLLEGDGQEAQEYARLKGEYEALETAGVNQQCGVGAGNDQRAITASASN